MSMGMTFGCGLGSSVCCVVGCRLRSLLGRVYWQVPNCSYLSTDRFSNRAASCMDHTVYWLQIRFPLIQLSGNLQLHAILALGDGAGSPELHRCTFHYHRIIVGPQQWLSLDCVVKTDDMRTLYYSTFGQYLCDAALARQFTGNLLPKNWLYVTACWPCYGVGKPACKCSSIEKKSAPGAMLD